MVIGGDDIFAFFAFFAHIVSSGMERRGRGRGQNFRKYCIGLGVCNVNIHC